MERDWRKEKTLKILTYFNSHAHVERDPLKSTLVPIILISTHTLTWSVTFIWVYGTLTISISTHTLTWSVTSASSAFSVSFISFQLTRSRGAWQFPFTSCSHTAYFNSHAHVERDNADETKFQEIVNFNSHAHVERDDRQVPWRYVNPKFQLTRSRGAWLSQIILIEWNRHFNSHAHVERDSKIKPWDWSEFDFNSHAHVERDYTPFNSFNFNLISTHTLTWSVTEKFPTINTIFDISTHTLTWSVTAVLSLIGTFIGFQLTRSRGAWRVFL